MQPAQPASIVPSSAEYSDGGTVAAVQSAHGYRAQWSTVGQQGISKLVQACTCMLWHWAYVMHGVALPYLPSLLSSECEHEGMQSISGACRSVAGLRLFHRV